MGATGDAEQPRGPGGAERGGFELGDAGAAGQLVLTVRTSPVRPGLGPGRASGSRDPGPRARERGGCSSRGVAVLAVRRPGCVRQGCLPS
jgi:hypothetical protein